MKKIPVFLSVFSFLLFASCSNKSEIRIACVGDSITEGAGIENQFSNSYPSLLDGLLGDGFNVLNCGQGGATMLKKSDHSYWNTNEMYILLAFKPDIITIALGTNDSKTHNWNADCYEQDYMAMIDMLKDSYPESEILICLPPPAFNHAWGINDSTITAGIIPILQRIATIHHLRVVDFYTPLTNSAALLPDGIHPDEAGAKVLADILYKAIINQ